MADSPDEGEISDSPGSPEAKGRGGTTNKRSRESDSEDGGEEEGQIPDRPSAPVHPSQQQSSSVNSPYDNGGSSVAASPNNADTPDPDYKDRVVSSRDRVFSGCSSIENYTLDVKVYYTTRFRQCLHACGG
jgi:hypothetical protein